MNEIKILADVTHLSTRAQDWGLTVERIDLPPLGVAYQIRLHSRILVRVPTFPDVENWMAGYDCAMELITRRISR